MENVEEYLSKYNEWCESLKEDTLDDRFVRSVLLGIRDEESGSTVVDPKTILSCYDDIIKKIKDEISDIRKDIFMKYMNIETLKVTADEMIRMYDKSVKEASHREKAVLEQVEEKYCTNIKNITNEIDRFFSDIDSYYGRLCTLTCALNSAEDKFKTVFDKVYPDIPKTESNIPTPSSIMGVLTPRG